MPMTGKQLKACRAQLGMTQKQFALQLGLHWNSLARMERGEIGISEPIVKLARLIVQVHPKGK